MPQNKNDVLKNQDQYINLGLNIAYYRKQEGITQEQLAEKAGISRTYLARIESCYRIATLSLKTLFSIASALEVPASKLLEFRD